MHYINGQKVSEQEFIKYENLAHTSNKHQGVFETMLCVNRDVPLLDFHIQRLNRTFIYSGRKIDTHLRADIKQIKLPNRAVIKYQHVFSATNRESYRLLDVQKSRNNPKEFSTEGISLVISDTRMPVRRSQIGQKNINRSFYNELQSSGLTELHQEILIVNSREEVIEGIKSNLFAIKDNCLITPQLTSGGVAGVMRAFLIQSARTLEIDASIKIINKDELIDMDAVFMSNALIGIWPVKQLASEQNALKTWQTMHPSVLKLTHSLPQEFHHA